MFDNPVFVVILLVVVAALGAAAGFFAGRSKGQEMARDAKTADLNEAKAQIEADRQEISELSTSVTQYRTQAEGLAQQLTYLKSQLAQAQRAEQERVERERERAAAEAERKQVENERKLQEQYLALEIEKQIKKRRWGQAIRLEMEAGTDKRLIKILCRELSTKKEDVFLADGPLDLTFLMKVYGLEGFDGLKAPKYTPCPAPEFEGADNIFDVIRKGDVLLHHPYQSFAPVVDFIRQASRDPDVLAIKQTLYRVSGNSPIIAALAQAAENGKQVSVLVELKARFDEENNIVWARKLEKAGCHVIYGLVGLKTHSKITLVVRREEDGIRRYVHLGTGNYNDATAKLYTDVGMMTANETIGEDATAVFNMLSGYSEPRSWNKLSLAPLWLKDRFLYLIGRETKNAQMGHGGHIIAKMNSLCDRDVIAALYEASRAGVKIELIVRGICCLKVGVPGVSENITVRSIVGNFLEHARIFYFENNGRPEYYCSSADWMPRNLERRVEILFPVEAPDLKEKLGRILEGQLADNLKAHVLRPDGTYEKVDRRGREAYCSQEAFCLQAQEESRKKEYQDTRIFIPETHMKMDEEHEN